MVGGTTGSGRMVVPSFVQSSVVEGGSVCLDTEASNRNDLENGREARELNFISVLIVPLF